MSFKNAYKSKAYIPLQRETSRVGGFALDNTPTAKFCVGCTNMMVSKNAKICVVCGGSLTSSLN